MDSVHPGVSNTPANKPAVQPTTQPEARPRQLKPHLPGSPYARPFKVYWA